MRRPDGPTSALDPGFSDCDVAVSSAAKRGKRRKCLAIADRFRGKTSDENIKVERNRRFMKFHFENSHSAGAETALANRSSRARRCLKTCFETLFFVPWPGCVLRHRDQNARHDS